jgi:hypothetical protein
MLPSIADDIEHRTLWYGALRLAPILLDPDPQIALVLPERGR